MHIMRGTFQNYGSGLDYCDAGVLGLFHAVSFSMELDSEKIVTHKVTSVDDLLRLQRFNESDIENCKSGNNWICPLPSCRSSLSRKQTLVNHLFAIHNLKVGLPSKKYKVYEYDETQTIPKSTYYNRMRRTQTGQESSSNSSISPSTASAAINSAETFRDETATETAMTLEVLDEGQEDADISEQITDLGENICSAREPSEDDHMEICRSDDSKNEISDEDIAENGLNADSNKEDNFQKEISPPLYVYPPSDTVQNSDITYKESILSMCSFVIKHNLSEVGFKDIIRLIEIHLPKSSLFETDVSYIKKMCGNISGCGEITVHEYCTKCSKLFSNDPSEQTCTTPQCDGRKSRNTGNLDRQNIFVSTSLETQIKSIMEREENHMKVTALKAYNPNSIKDITSGKMYVEMKTPGGFLHPADNNNITLTCFTDGVPLFKSSKVSLWPLYLVINELPPSERFLKKNMMIWGIWQGSSKLRMNTFLYPFVLDLQKLSTIGFTFNKGKSVVSGKARLVIATMDLQARAPVLNMTHHNGKHGCLYCETEGLTVPSGGGYARAYPFTEDPFRSRTDESIKQNVDDATKDQKVTLGIKGPSVLSAVPGYSITSGTVIDYMHGILLGITKKMLQLWFQGSSFQESYFIGHEIVSIDKMMKAIKPPYMLRRLPRKIENNYQHWKASECRSWLLHYSLPCLVESSLPEVYIHHFACLVEGIHILLGDDIKDVQLDRADLLLKKFYEHFSDLYCENAVGLNVHNLYHIVQCVRNWGPLWSYSCFGFESFNADLLKLVHGIGNVANQILWSIKAQKELELQTKLLPEGDVKSFFRDMLKGSVRSLPRGTQAYHCSVVKTSNCSVKEEIREQMKTLLRRDVPNTEVVKCEKIVFGQIVIYSRRCTRVKKRNSYTVEIEPQQDGANVMQVEYFLMETVSKRVFAVSTLYKTSTPAVRGRAPHCQLLELKRVEALVMVTSAVIKDLLVFIEGQNGSKYISRIPNFVERD